MSKRLLLALLGVLAFGPAAFPAFTGNVPVDFNGTGVVVVPDDPGDVGLPGLYAPVGTISGWDMLGAHFQLDRDAATLEVGLDFRGIAGDADGNGLDGSTAAWLAGRGGVDSPNLTFTESICIAFDFDEDGDFDVIAGDRYNTDASNITVSQYDEAELDLPRAFGTDLAGNTGASFYTPAAATPDFEISLLNLGDFEDLQQTTFCFTFLAFAGSNRDDGIGEDYVGGQVCFTDDGTVETTLAPASPDLLRAFPNPFNPATTLAVELAETGHATLSIHNLAGQTVRTLVDGNLSAGTHQLAFDASSLPSGLYVARLATAQGVTATRLLLTK